MHGLWSEVYIALQLILVHDLQGNVKPLTTDHKHHSGEKVHLKKKLMEIIANACLNLMEEEFIIKALIFVSSYRISASAIYVLKHV